MNAVTRTEAAVMVVWTRREGSNVSVPKDSKSESIREYVLVGINHHCKKNTFNFFRTYQYVKSITSKIILSVNRK